MDVKRSFLTLFQIQSRREPSSAAGVWTRRQSLWIQLFDSHIPDTGDDNPPFDKRTEWTQTIEIDCWIKESVGATGQ